MSIAIYSGSFDPITNGHLSILKSGVKIFDKVIVAVSYNINKQEFLPVQTRIDLIKNATKEIKNIEVDSYGGLTAEYAKQKGAKYILRGVRNSNDYEYEANMAGVNNILNDDLETVLLIAKPEIAYISSSAVKEILANGGDVSKFVPKVVYEYLKNKI